MSKSVKTWLIIAASLVVAGGMIFTGVMTVLKWDFTKLSTVNYETNEYKIGEDYKNISIITKTADVLFVTTKEETSVVCHEQKNMKHSVSVQNGTLLIEIKDTRNWYEHIGINFGTSKITVYIPKAHYGEISVKSSTGDIGIEKITANTLDLCVSTGGITVSEVDCSGDVKIKVSTGKTNLTDIKCKNLISGGNTGDVCLKNVIATEKFSIERSTGDIKLAASDAAEIFIKTDTGDVKGSLLSEKVFVAQTDTGRIDVPKTVTGGKCEISTDTGDIKITVN